MRGVLDDVEIGKYLRENPNFFIDNEEVLEALRIPHQDKGTISLIEKQLEISKMKQREAQEQILGFFKNANENAAIFKKTQSFLREAIVGDSENKFFESLHSGTHTHLGCEYSLIILGRNESEISSFIQIRDKSSLSIEILKLFRSATPILGPLSKRQKKELFFQETKRAKSFAIVPIRDNQKNIALFNLGHESPEFFSERKETFFLEFLADMFSVLIPKNLKHLDEKL
ncbi:DUF484 family protein [Gammaproteobacteria bacterium]|nr:DUF484 family protein [Gammaproteobacteria bacterium]